MIAEWLSGWQVNLWPSRIIKFHSIRITKCRHKLLTRCWKVWIKHSESPPYPHNVGKKHSRRTVVGIQALDKSRGACGVPRWQVLMMLSLLQPLLASHWSASRLVCFSMFLFVNTGRSSDVKNLAAITYDVFLWLKVQLYVLYCLLKWGMLTKNIKVSRWPLTRAQPISSNYEAKGDLIRTDISGWWHYFPGQF